MSVEADNAKLGSAYWRLWTATTASSAGDGLLSVALPLAAATRTRNAAAVALVLVAQRLPWAVCSVPAGAMAGIQRTLVCSS